MGETLQVFLRRLHRRVDGVEGEIEKERLLLVPIDEANRFVREEIGSKAIDLLDVPATVDQVVRIARSELRVRVLAQGVVVCADEEAVAPQMRQNPSEGKNALLARCLKTLGDMPKHRMEALGPHIMSELTRSR